jgi:hypothetical protein
MAISLVRELGGGPGKLCARDPFLFHGMGTPVHEPELETEGLFSRKQKK